MVPKATSAAAGRNRGRLAAHHLALVGLIFLLGFTSGAARASEDSVELMISYMESYQKLGPRDVDGRMTLAEWCGAQGMAAQQADLLLEVLKLQPGHIAAYRKLLDADEHRTLAVDPDWAAKLEALLGPAYHLHHGRHFTVLTDVDEMIAKALADAMEDDYNTFYLECAAIGLMPMPPGRRLVSVLFSTHGDYADFLRRFEGVTTPWAGGYYSWRTNRVVFFHDYDHPAFKDLRQILDSADRRIAQLRAELEALPASDTARRMRIHEQLKKLNAGRDDIMGRLAVVTRQTTLAKVRHEITHQLLCNSGIQSREGYPRWLGEGLAACFEATDGQGRTGPRLVERIRLTTYRRAARAGRLWPLKSLILSAPQDPDSEDRVLAYYAQAWALTHYFWNRHTDQFRAYLQAMAMETDSRKWPAIFHRHFGDDFAALGRDLNAYVDSLPETPR